MKNMKYTNKHIFLLLFLILIMVPNILIFINGDATNTENRVLSESPKLNIKEIGKFPSEFETYYNDNLPLKLEMTKVNSLLSYKLLNTSPKDYVIKGKDGWLFYNSSKRGDANSIADFQGTNHYSTEQLEHIKNRLLEMEQITNENGAEFILVFAPNKSSIYDEYMPDYFLRINKQSKLDNLVEYLKVETDLKIVYPKNELIANKNKNLYYKLDTHWNELGAYIAFEEYMETLYDIKIPKLKTLEIISAELNHGDLSGMINLNSGELEDRNYEIKNKKTYGFEEVYSNGTAHIEYLSENKNGLKLLSFRDSFCTALIPYISQTYENSTFIWSPNFDESMVQSQKPDVVMLEMVERYTDFLLS